MTELRLKDEATLASQAPSAYRAGAKCDSDGNIFVQLGYYDPTRMRMETVQGISEVMPEDKRVQAYGASPLSQSDYPHAGITSFGVSPDGKVYALIRTRPDASEAEPKSTVEYYVERFENDGTTDAIIPIKAPPGAAHWFADLLAPFSDGSLLIAGTITPTASQPGASSWRPFTGVYDSSGRFIREVTLPNDITNQFAKGAGSVQESSGSPTATPPHGTAPRGAENSRPAPPAKAQAAPPTSSPKPRQFFEVSISTGGLVSGPDGNVWVLRASNPLRLYAVDSAGDVVEHVEFSPPTAGLTPFAFGFVGPEQIYFDFVHFAGPTGASGPSEVLAVFNTVSRQLERLYDLPEINKGLSILGCSDGRGGFLYLGSTPEGRLLVDDYGP